MQQITLSVSKVGEVELGSSDERIFNVARMLNIRDDGNVKFEYPMRGNHGLEELQTIEVDESFGDVQSAIGAADAIGAGEAIVLTATGTQAVTVASRYTELNGVTNEASGNRTLNLTIEDTVPLGALLLLRSKTAGTQTMSFGTAIDAPNITGEAGKTFTQLFVYNGTAFYPAGSAVKID